MKLNKIMLLPLLLLGSCIEQEHEDNIERLKRFYTYYITEVGTNGRKGVNRDTLEKYCTKRFLAHAFEDTSLDLDFDPITWDDKCKPEWAKTIMVMKASESRIKEYRVSYLVDKKYTSHNFLVILGKENKEWRIDGVQDVRPGGK